MSDLAKGWFPKLSPAAGVGCSGQSNTAIMQAAKKLLLLDEFDKEYKRLQKPADAVAKTSHSLQLTAKLGDPSISDDRKVREYVAALHR